MAILRLGVLDIPYTAASTGGSADKDVKKFVEQGGGSKGVTTGDVAEFLEEKYHVMETFADRNEDEIADEWAEHLADAMADVAAGAPLSSVDPGLVLGSEVGTMFREFIDSRAMDGADGVPTDAARRGVNHRLKHPYAKDNPERPSFRDTGLYEASFVAQVLPDGSS